jgi:folate-binding protein YgfZ
VNAEPSSHPPARYARLAVTGRDAETFLQGQLTQDVAGVLPGTVVPAAYLTAQGRVLGIPWLARTPEGFELLLPADLARPLAERLARYVLRSKVAFGLDGDPAPLAARVAARLGELGGGAAAAAGEAEPADARFVRAGLAQITAATSEEWIPQMLNLDRVGAVSFTKGCYPGQEIVARTQHLGRIKRRLLRYGVAVPAGSLAVRTPLLAGAEKVGEVAVVTAAPEGSECLAVVNLEARERPLTLADGTPCRPLPLPYALD